MTADKPIGIFGIGSVLMGDDGWGPLAARTLASRWELPADVLVRDMGTPGPGLVAELVGLRALIVLDTVNGDGPPGEIRIYDREGIVTQEPTARVGPHDPALNEALLEADMFGGGPDPVFLVGAIPEKVKLGEMTPAVKAAVDPALGEVIRLLGEMGIDAKRREVELESDEAAPWFDSGG